MSDEIEALKKELKEVRSRILLLQMQLKNAEILYAAEVTKAEKLARAKQNAAKATLN